ncbi:cytochrome P450 [Alloacidobacterium sp.]|uniref:cytochrome P450 n=1 Tax=Alloacidobacterium sp. TaxID=2951999 RepID=UPI002D6A7DBB|nr:cytochrome P450 [Alloacidobacterium sp.]HYK37317.1 cytochrome P450 [Alloacidobacterium sp.]
MSGRPEEYAGPRWTDDHLDSPFPPEIKEPYFDDRLGAWILSRYADVSTAFRRPDLIPTGAKGGANNTMADKTAQMKMRAETKTALSPKHLREWQKILAPHVGTLVQGMPAGKSVDLVADFAHPACRVLAVAITGADPDDAERLEKLALHVSAAAAEPFNPEIGERAKAANTQLRPCFHSGPESLRDSGFVALTHTLPCLLANAWFALLGHPPSWKRLHKQPTLLPQAVEELLRYAGLTRLLFRRAGENIDLNGIQIRKGERVILRITVANRDTSHFPHPHHLDWAHQGKGHLTLGGGLHSCVGANLTRMAVITITRPLLERFARAEITGTVEWRGGPVFRAPAILPVVLHEES